MKYSEFRRWLERQGAKFTPGRGSHHRVTLNDRTSTFPDHGSKEIKTGWYKRSKKTLALNEESPARGCLRTAKSGLPSLTGVKNMLHYPITLVPDDGTLEVVFTDLPDVHSVGDNEEEAVREAMDALLTGIEMYM
ncbi:MAG: type II toxin-antitoxin system HicA family toxin, partial [Duganella sp.]